MQCKHDAKSTSRLALTWDTKGAYDRLKEQLGIEGIPGLVFLAPDGFLLVTDGASEIRKGNYPAPHLFHQSFRLQDELFLQAILAGTNFKSILIEDMR